MSGGRPPRGELRQLLLEHLWRTRFSTLAALLCLIGAILTELLAPWPLKVIFDRVLLGKPLQGALAVLDGLFRFGALPAVAALSAAVLLLVALGGALSYVQVYLATRSGYEFAAALRQRLFSHIQRLPLAFHSRARAGELLMKASTDTAAIRDAIADWGVRSAYQFLMIGGMLVVMAVVNWRLSLVVLGSLPVLYLVLTRLNRRIKASVSRQRRQEGRIAARMGEVSARSPWCRPSLAPTTRTGASRSRTPPISPTASTPRAPPRRSLVSSSWCARSAPHLPFSWARGRRTAAT